MVHLNVFIPCYDDLEHLERALESLEPFRDRLSVYVVDGRYATFPGDTDVTPGAEELVGGFGFEYHVPSKLPLDGSEEVRFRINNHYDAPLHMLRLPQHAQAKWVNYDLLPQDEWVLEMDTDERLAEIDWEALASLDEKRKYVPTVWQEDGTQLTYPVRLYVPRYWTFWIDDVLLWRGFYPRDTPVEQLFEAHHSSSHRATNYGGVTDAIEMENEGRERPQEYQERRARQLEEMGSTLAARAVRDGKQPSMVDLKEYIREDESLTEFAVSEDQ